MPALFLNIKNKYAPNDLFLIRGTRAAYLVCSSIRITDITHFAPHMMLVVADSLQMPLVKSYRRYVPESTFGIISSGDANIALLQNGTLAAPALEDVIVWDLRNDQKVGVDWS
jgi:hypothetical protein